MQSFFYKWGLCMYLLTSFYWSFAQNYPIKFGHIGSNNGLSQVTIFHVYEDHLGLLWLGTGEGLNRYDGTDIITYLPIAEDSTSISDGFIKKIVEDEHYNLWITTSNGLNRLNRYNGEFSRFLMNKDESDTTWHAHLTDIMIDKSQTMWIGTLKGGLYKKEKGDVQFHYYPAPSEYEDINCIFEDSENNFWVGFETGQVALFNRQTGGFKKVEELSDSVEVRCFYEDGAGNFWVGTDTKGLKLFDRKTRKVNQFINQPSNPNSITSNVIWCITEDSQGNLMMGTEEGVNFLNYNTFSKDQPFFWNIQQDPINTYGLSANFVRYIYHSAENNTTWFGNTETGVDYWDREKYNFIHYHATGTRKEDSGIKVLSNKVVWSVYADNEKYIWCGTSNGLNQINRITGEVRYYYHDPDNPQNSLGADRIWSIIGDKGNPNVLWIGTSDAYGITKMTLNHSEQPDFKLYQGASSNSIRCLYQDSFDNIWLGTNKGLSRFDEATTTYKHYVEDKSSPQALSNDYIRCILQDSKGRLWIGTSSGGLNLFDYATETFTAFQHSESDSLSLSSNRVRALYEDQNGQLWAGTSAGLDKMIEKNNQIYFKNYSTLNGLPNNTIYAVQGDSLNRIWVSSNKGLSCLHPETEVIKNFTLEDGLQNMEFNSNTSFKNKKGELFFGGVNGFNFFQPEKLLMKDVQPAKVILTEFRLNNKPVPVNSTGRLRKNIHEAETIHLLKEDKVFSFRFAALDLSNRVVNRYAYKLEGWDEDWNYVEQQNLAFYTNIPHGEYTFMVKTASKNGSWDTTPTTLGVIIAPAFWQTSWFWLLMFLATIGLVIFIIWVRTVALNRQNQILEDTVKERTDELNRQKENLQTALSDLKNTQTKLIQSERLASLGQLTAGIAHEINNPINFVASNVQALKMDFEDIQELLEKITELKDCEEEKICLNDLLSISDRIDTEYLSEEVNELIGGIERGAKRTQNIVTSLRAFSRNDQTDFMEADIHEGLNSTLTILNSQIRDKITIHKNYGDIPQVKCQIGKLNQVFLNIIVNALQAIEEEGDIYISTQKLPNKVLVQIKDTGKGMDTITQKQIFEPFFTTKEVGDGTGLGLAISYGIIEEHGGTIEVQSKKGVGTTFNIFLPF